MKLRSGKEFPSLKANGKRSYCYNDLSWGCSEAGLCPGRGITLELSCMGVNEAPSPPSAHRHTNQLGTPGKAHAPLQHLISSSGAWKQHLPLGVILSLKLANIPKALSARGWHAAGAILSISYVDQRHLTMRAGEGAGFWRPRSTSWCLITSPLGHPWELVLLAMKSRTGRSYRTES